MILSGWEFDDSRKEKSESSKNENVISSYYTVWKKRDVTFAEILLILKWIPYKSLRLFDVRFEIRVRVYLNLVNQVLRASLPMRVPL